ncbi:MAG: glycosyltransferase family 39 protein [Phormidesmis sp.]
MTTQKLPSGKFNRGVAALPRWLPITLILTVATVLFTYQLGREGLWIDELYSIRDASQNPFDVYQTTRKRPLYYLLLMGWMQLGSSDAWLRSLSVIFAIVSVFLIYRLGRRLAGEETGLVAASLLTLSPLFINHAQEVRMYVLSLCMGLAGTLFLTEALLTEPSQQPSQKSLAGWSFFRLLAIYTVPLNVTLLLPDVLIILLRFWRQRTVLIRFGAWLGLLLLLWSPTVLRVAAAARPNTEYAISRAKYLAPPGLNNLVYPLKFWMVAPQIVRTGPVAHLFYKAFTLLVAGVLGAGLIRKHKSPAVLWMLAWFVLPLIPIIIFSRISAQLWEPRYVLFVSPYLFLLIAAGFTRLWRQWKPAAAIALTLYLFAMAWALSYYYSVQNRSDYRFNVETIEQYEQAGDAIVWGYEWDEPLQYYYDGSADTYWLDMHDVETPGGVQQWVSQLPSEGYKRLWLVLDDPRPVTEEFETAIADKYQIEDKFKYEHLSAVMLLTPLDVPSIPAPSK